jgi:hypothetical protein
MRQRSCPREVEVVEAVRTGAWEEALFTHVSQCPFCKDIIEASRWMQALAEKSDGTLTLPDPSMLWWSAQFSEKQASAEKAQGLLEWVEIISITIVSAGLAGWIGWNWNALQTILTSFLTDSWPQFWITASSEIGTTPILSLLSTVILSFITVVLAYPLLERD